MIKDYNMAHAVSSASTPRVPGFRVRHCWLQVFVKHRLRDGLATRPSHRYVGEYS